MYHPAKEIPVKRICKIALASISWAGIILQLSIASDSLFNFISYFTILANLFIAISLSISLIKPASKIGIFLDGVSVQSALALYIFVVAVIYNSIIRGAWTQTTAQFIADNLLHVLIPVLYILYWLIFVPKGILKWKDLIHWIYFPLIYLLYCLLRGALIGWYPYFFINVNELGYSRVFINIAMILALMLFGGALLIALNRLLKKKAMV